MKWPNSRIWKFSIAVKKYSFEVLFYVVFILIGQFASVLVTGPFSDGKFPYKISLRNLPTKGIQPTHLGEMWIWHVFWDQKLQGCCFSHLFWIRNYKQLLVSSRSSNISKLIKKNFKIFLLRNTESGKVNQLFDNIIPYTGKNQTSLSVTSLWC